MVPTILQLLAKDGLSATIAEHAASVLSLLAQNPDTHFHMVGCGAVPALVPYLASGEAGMQAGIQGLGVAAASGGPCVASHALNASGHGMAWVLPDAVLC